MIEKDPFGYSLLTYLWVFGLSAWGGLASYFRNVRDGHTKRFSILELVGEMVISAFAGMLTFWLCELAAFPPLLTAAFVGVSGHMGSRAIALLEQSLQRKFGGRSE
ncbi:hypothetical protein FKG94_03170 [Exilibacterium tricleocarpae]|uniref:Holin n=1 Tax=Exilibacterium tricleocarpae TaxID=2591008 RepID=A0A545U6W3_9GAMM|nr:phage holin family protein [Exilibacterium tricleocarpae]TQV85205.1 hypothetical protein FKG94_03170 [Exilibacterium tricleocarpae]